MFESELVGPAANQQDINRVIELDKTVVFVSVLEWIEPLDTVIGRGDVPVLTPEEMSAMRDGTRAGQSGRRRGL